MKLISLRDAKPGDEVCFSSFSSLESASTNKEIFIAARAEYCLCIGRVEQATTHGLRLLKVYFLTQAGVGYKRFNLDGDKRSSGSERPRWRRD